MLVLAHTAHVHFGSNVCPSLALPVESLEAPFAVAVPTRVAHPLHGIDVAHRTLHLQKYNSVSVVRVSDGEGSRCVFTWVRLKASCK